LFNLWRVNHCYHGGVSPELHHDERITAFGLFIEAYAGLVARLSGQLAEHRLSLVEFEVLIRLARSPERRLRMTELAGQVALTTSGVTRAVDRLERDRLVRRQACPSDRRGSWAVLTATGFHRLTAALPGHLALVERHFTGRFPPAELARVVDRLRDIRDDVRPHVGPSTATGGGAAPATGGGVSGASRSGAGRAATGSGATTGRTGGRNHRRGDAAMDLPDESVSARR
jgi:DNA-binding MarR family transcriptional regulator